MKKKARRILMITASAAVLLFLLLYLLLADIVLHYVNRTLDSGLPGYRGRIGDLDLALWAGGYYLQDVQIDKIDGEKETPFFRAESLDFTLLWKALLDGRFAGEVEMVRPEVVFIHGDSEEETQVGEDGEWLQVIKDLTPFELGRAEIVEGAIVFRYTRGDEVHGLALTEVNMVAENLSNYRDVPGQVVGTVQATALFADQAPIELRLSLDPMDPDPLFDADFRIRNLETTLLNPLTRAYADFDFERGEADVSAELAVKDGEVRGYIKLVLTDLAIARYNEDVRQDEDDLFLFTWENLVGFFVFLGEENSVERFATIVPITGSYEEPDVDAFAGVINAFKNAYGSGIRNGLENNTDLQAGFESDPDVYKAKLDHAVENSGAQDGTPPTGQGEDAPDLEAGPRGKP